MSTEVVITRSQLELSSSGEVFIPRNKLVAMPLYELENANQALLRLIEANPDYEFSSQEEILRGGIAIKWRKIA